MLLLPTQDVCVLKNDSINEQTNVWKKETWNLG